MIAARGGRYPTTPAKGTPGMQGEERRARWADAIPAGVRGGLELFNAGAYLHQHEVLEAAWLAERGPIRDLYRGILQIGVGLYHLERGNYRGALNLLDYGIARLVPFEPACMGIDVAALLDGARRCRAEVARLGPDGLPAFDRALLPTVTFVAAASR